MPQEKSLFHAPFHSFYPEIGFVSCNNWGVSYSSGRRIWPERRKCVDLFHRKKKETQFHTKTNKYMEKEKKQQLKEGVASGSSTFVGAVAGVTLGTLVTPDEAAAQETTESHITTAPETPTQPEEPAQPEKPTQPEPAPQPEPSIEVLHYETVSNPDGSQSDVAVVSIDGETAVVVDIDQDGTADVLAADLNHNNQLEENELVDLSANPIPMQPLAEAAGTHPDPNTLLMADNEPLPDYVNDAPAGDYMA